MKQLRERVHGDKVLPTGKSAEARDNSWARARYEIRFDPDRLGGFRRGARLTYEEMRDLLKTRGASVGLQVFDRQTSRLMRVQSGPEWKLVRCRMQVTKVKKGSFRLAVRSVLPSAK